jgi:hypothetical protein
MRTRPTRLAFAGALVIGLAILLATSGAIVPSRLALGASTTLAIIGGLVETSHGDAAYAQATDGEVLGRGDAVRTGTDGRAVLTYFDGSTVTIEPSSELIIEEVTTSPDGTTVVEMTQVIGHTWHVVERQLSPTSKYEIHSPAATAVVRGTTFEVLVEPDEAGGEPRMTVLTAKGTVAMRRAATFASAGEEVLVPEGTEAEARPGRRIEAARPRAEPERVVTVTLGSERSVVVDPLGRANGLRDGKLVLETPGARVERVDGKLVITMPNLPEGRLNAQVERGRADEEEVTVETRVKERGRDEERVEERASVPSGGRVTLDLDLRRGQRPELRVRPQAGSTASASPTATASPPSPRLPTVPPVASPRGGSEGASDPSASQRTAAPRRSTPARATGRPSVQLSPLPTFPSRTPEPASDRAADRGGDRDKELERGSGTREPSRVPPDFKLPALPKLGGTKDR